MAEETNAQEPSSGGEITSQEVGQWLLNHSGDKDSSDQQLRDDFNLMADTYRRLSAEEQSGRGLAPSPAEITDPMADMGFFEGIVESATGTARETELTRSLPSYTRMPEFAAITNALPILKMSIGTAAGTPQEMASIISTQFPEVEVEQDNNGNYIFKSALDGQRYVIKPGFETGDIPRMVTQAGLYAPAAIGTTALAVAGAPALPLIAGGAALLAVNEIGYQKLQETFGGEFNWGDVVASAVIPAGLQTLGNAIKNTWRSAINLVRPPKNVGTKPNLTQGDVDELAKKAIDGDLQAQRELAELASIDPEVVDAAERLGISEYLQPDHVSTDIQFIELMQLIKSWKGGTAKAQERENLIALGDAALDQVAELGAEDMSSISASLYGRMKGTRDALSSQEENLWNGLRAMVPENFEYTPTALINELKQKIINGQGDVSVLRPFEREFLERLSPEDIIYDGNVVVKSNLKGRSPTFLSYERFREDMASGFKNRGPFRNQDARGLRNFYGKVVDEEGNLFRQFDDANNQLSLLEGVDTLPSNSAETFDLARSTSVLLRGFEDDMASLFDKKISGYLGGKLRGAISELQKGNAVQFKEFVEAIPAEERQSVIVSGLSSMFGNQTKNGSLNFNTFSRFYTGLKNQKEAYNTLTKYLPADVIQTFEDLNTVSTSINRAIQENVSRTGASLQLGDLLATETVVGRVYEVAKGATVRAPIEAVTTAVGLPGSGLATALILSMQQQGRTDAQKAALEAANNLVTSPGFMNMVRDQFSEESVRRFGLTPAWRRFSRAVNYPQDAADQFIRSAYAAATTAINTGETAAPVQAAEEEVEVTIPPQARVAPPAPQTRGVPGMGAETTAPAPEAAAPTGPVSPSSREMLQQLFPTDFIA
jgi:hypothetical protein